MTESTLRFQPKMSDSGKLLRCRAENPVMPASQIEDTWSLDINCKFTSVFCPCTASESHTVRGIAFPRWDVEIIPDHRVQRIDDDLLRLYITE